MKDICFTDYFVNTFYPLHPNYTKDDLVKSYEEFYNKSIISDSYPYSFSNFSLLVTALCHKSFYHESDQVIGNYERLEFLGDAVLELCTTKILLNRYPQIDEGKLSKLRSSFVNEETLSKLALYCQLNKGVLLGKGEFKNHQGQNKSILADVFEAMLAVVEIEKGLNSAIEVLGQIVDGYNKKNQTDLFDITTLNTFDAKSKLQELLMANYKAMPEYFTTEIKVNKKTQFEVKLLVNKTNLGQLTHFSKKKAMQLLAQSVLENQTYKKLDTLGGQTCC